MSKTDKQKFLKICRKNVGSAYYYWNDNLISWEEIKRCHIQNRLIYVACYYGGVIKHSQWSYITDDYLIYRFIRDQIVFISPDKMKLFLFPLMLNYQKEVSQFIKHYTRSYKIITKYMKDVDLSKQLPDYHKTKKKNNYDKV